MTKHNKEEKQQQKREKEAEATENSNNESGAEGESSEETGNAESSTETEAPAEAKPAEQQEDAETKFMRLMADFQNYKKRVIKEKSDIYALANEKIVIDLLEILDNFERALEHESSDEGFKTGMEMIFKQLQETLQKAGLEEIPAQGETFDPNVHNAVMTEETDQHESGTVSQVLQKGYTLNGKVIRPSMVKVAQS